MKRFFSIMSMVGLVGISLFVTKSAHAGNEGIKVGVLSCSAVKGSGYNLIITSKVDIKCKFTDAFGGKEFYIGETGIGLGVDLNLKTDERIAFSVISASTDYRAGKHGLAGKFAGAKASASLGLGGGAAVLVGGGKSNFSLQPLALEANKGIGAAGGLGYLYLEPWTKKNQRRK